MTIKKPMLASPVGELENLKFPLLASPKLDGIRAVMVNGKLLSRTLKPIRNKHIRETLERLLPDGMDGEIMSGVNFQECTSAVMSPDGEPDFVFHAFDFLDPSPFVKGFAERFDELLNWYDNCPHKHFVVVDHVQLNCIDDIMKMEAEMLARGYEGIMLRDPNGPYKMGRATTKEGYLLKLKRFTDSEAEVIGFVEMQHNNNPKEVNELGRTKRSSSKVNKVPANTLGTLQVRDIHTKVEFEVGTGFTAANKKEIWDNQSKYLGKLVKYKYQGFGVKEKPRLPVFLGFRDIIDI